MMDFKCEDALAAVECTETASADLTTHTSGRDLARRMQIDCQAMGVKLLMVMHSNMPGDWPLIL